CQRLGVPLSVESVDVAGYRAAHPGESVEMAARKLRYDALKAMCKGGKLATAHTASDNTETLLINLARGTGPNGLCGIPPCNGPIVRPLLESTREQVEAYLATLGQDYITDSTNLSDDYTRNRIRHRVAAPLRDMHPTLELAVTRLTEAMWADRAYFAGEVDRAMGRAKRPGAPDCFCRTSLRALPDAIRLRVLGRVLEGADVYPEARLRRLADGLLSRGSGAVGLGVGVRLCCDAQSLWIERTAPVLPKIERTEFSVKDLLTQIPLGGGKFLSLCPLSEPEIKLFVNKRGNEFKNVLDCDRLDKILTVRSRQEGDTLRLVGRGCTKSFKNLFQEAKIPLGQRDAAAVLESRAEIVWAEHFGVSESAAVTEQTRRAVLVQISEKE
ncbi:MAG: tRNA lysidine(34) synthetase TilS, partial [Oscillospiraceae bacterium]